MASRIPSQQAHLSSSKGLLFLVILICSLYLLIPFSSPDGYQDSDLLAQSLSAVYSPQQAQEDGVKHMALCYDSEHRDTVSVLFEDGLLAHYYLSPPQVYPGLQPAPYELKLAYFNTQKQRQTEASEKDFQQESLGCIGTLMARLNRTGDFDFQYHQGQLTAQIRMDIGEAHHFDESDRLRVMAAGNALKEAVLFKKTQALNGPP